MNAFYRAIVTLLLPLSIVTSQAFAGNQSSDTDCSIIKHINIVHMTHTDIGFTDHPLVCRRQQMRYLDIAIDAVLATSDRPAEGRFHWTAETTLAVDDWWKTADPQRRDRLFEGHRHGAA